MHPHGQPRFGALRDHRPYAVSAVLLGVTAGSWRALLTRSAFEDRGQLELGVAAAVLLAIGVLIAVRRALAARPAGSLRTWYLVHVWTGVLFGPVVLLHAGSPLGGALGPALWLSALVLWASGVGLSLWQWRALRSLSREGSDAGLLDDLDAERRRLESEIGDLERKAPSPADSERLALDRQALARVRARIAFHRFRALALAAHGLLAALVVALSVIHVLAVTRY